MFIYPGEIQKELLARAILKDSKILLLWMKHQHILTDNEFELQKVFKNILKDKTVIS